MGTHESFARFSFQTAYCPEVGGARRDRTADLLHAMQALSQLSYGPTCWQERNNSQPLSDAQAFVTKIFTTGERCGMRVKYDA